MAIQQLMLGVGAKKKTYIDDVFNTDLWTGDGATHQVVNNINLSGDGGMVWMKSRSHSNNHLLADTVRGSNKVIFPDGNAVEQTSTGYFTSFNSNGFTTGDSSYVYESGKEMAGWSFKKAKGWFDVVTYTGNGSARTISHSLGSIPGLIIIKNLDSTESWRVYHRDLGATHRLLLNHDFVSDPESGAFNNTAPTASVFTVGTDNAVNQNGDDFVAYLFAGGESTAATARSVDFDGNDYISVGSSSDYTFGTGDFTVECWVKNDVASSNVGFFQIGNTSDGLQTSDYADTVMASHNGAAWRIYGGGSSPSFTEPMEKGQWYHIAYVRASGVSTLYVNGTKKISQSDTTDYDGTTVAIGSYYSIGQRIDGSISNLRVVKGTAVYTSSFRPPTKPLTNITNTKLLCCNNSSVTGSTVAAGSFSVNSSDPTASTDSPFDDPEGFVFGDSKEGIIKCGSYVGNGNNDGVAVELGWEPQYILVKCTDLSENWYIMDSMRGIISGGSGEPNLIPNSDGGESTISQIDLTPTGFKCKNSDDKINGDGHKYIYIAIRRPDGYVGKPADAGTDVFAMDTGNGNQSIPNFDSGFPVDFSTQREFASNCNWYTGARLTGNKYVFTDSNGSEGGPADDMVWDSNLGIWANGGGTTAWQSWMWKRHAGFDVVTYKGNAVEGRHIPHSLSKKPEMMWVKSRSDTDDWFVYHKGLNGETNPEQYHLHLNTDGSQSQSINAWNNQAPTSTHFIIDDNDGVNEDGDNFIAMLFSSVDGISKVGYYDGSDSEQTITTGFQPRFLMIKRVNTTGHWYVIDTIRGWASGNDPFLKLNSNSSQTSDTEFGAPTSTGFTLDGNHFMFNDAGDKFIYYAHA